MNNFVIAPVLSDELARNLWFDHETVVTWKLPIVNSRCDGVRLKNSRICYIVTDRTSRIDS